MNKFFTKILLITLIFSLSITISAEARRHAYKLENSEKYKSRCITLPEKGPLNIWFKSASHDLAFSYDEYVPFSYMVPVYMPMPKELEKKYDVYAPVSWIAPVFYEVPEKNAFVFFIRNKGAIPVIAYKFNCTIYDAAGQVALNRDFVVDSYPIDVNQTKIVACWEETFNKIDKNLLEKSKSCIFKVKSVTYVNGNIERFNN